MFAAKPDGLHPIPETQMLGAERCPLTHIHIWTAMEDVFSLPLSIIEIFLKIHNFHAKKIPFFLQCGTWGCLVYFKNSVQSLLLNTTAFSASGKETLY